jgi:prepilin-type N-terminal cleavage/methylation domain-containing protein
MRTHARRSGIPSEQAGFSLIELLIVIIIIVVMAAVALPNLLQAMRNYKVRGAAQQVASMVQTARSKAIMRNVNTGAFFGIIDENTYGFLIEDPPIGPGSSNVAHLPDSVQFVLVTTDANTGVRFDRLGRAMRVTASPVPVVPCPATQLCDDNAGSYVEYPATGTAIIKIRDFTTLVELQVEVAPGGRVRVKAPAELAASPPPGL